jgi:undecaprenyl diphosphate synthase
MPEELKLPRGTVVPDHIALIPDGDRRWARARGLSPLEGHKAGYNALKNLAKASRDLGIHTLTLWGFSTENWERSPKETENIMNLARKMVNDFMNDAIKDGVRLVHLGRKDRLPADLLEMIRCAEEKSKNNNKHILNIALDYGGRDEIIRAVQKIVKDKVPAQKIDEKLFEKYLDTKGQPHPNPDLFIRTSGEQRTSGLLPWQTVYSEFYFEPSHLPDFTPEKFREAILDFSRRRRRFGGNDVEEHLRFDPELTAKMELSWWRLKNVPEGMRLRDYVFKHIKEQYGLSKELGLDAAKLLVGALIEEKKSKFDEARQKMKAFYQLIKDELKLAFEPKVVASLDVNLRRERGEDEETTKEYLAEVYRISLFQAAKAAHLRVLAHIESNKGNWKKAEDYLKKYYEALKERVA